jgi:hypothetical protein
MSSAAAAAASDSTDREPAATAAHHKRKGDDPAMSLAEQVRAAKRQRSIAFVITLASSALAAGLMARDTRARFNALGAFVTLALNGQPAPVEKMRQLITAHAFCCYEDELEQLTRAANSTCSTLSAVHPQLLEELFHDLLSCAPSLALWSFVHALSASCRVALPSAVCAQYSEVLHGELSSAIHRGWFKGPYVQALVRGLSQCGFDFNQRNAKGNSLLIDCFLRNSPGNDTPMMSTLLQHGATPWVSNSINKQTLLRIWMDQGHFSIVRDILLEQSPWDTLLPQLDWWAEDDKGRTPLQMAQEKARTPINHNYTRCKMEIEAAITVSELLPVLRQHWQQTERPLLVRSLVEHASLCSDVAQLVVSFVDGQERA